MSKTYTYQEALEASKKYFEGNELSARVFVDKYALRNTEGELLELTPDDMHHRIANEIARIEKKKFKEPYSVDFIYDCLKNFERIIPQGSPMFGIGNTYQYTTISNCYVLPSPEDSYLGLMYTDTQITQISSRRGGVGWDMSNLRPKGMMVRNAAKSTTGLVSFMKRFSNTIREVCQSGRRGASLQSISVNHPEVIDFINSKRDNSEVTGSNISVKFTDEFLRAVDSNDDFELRWPVNDNVPRFSQTVKARTIWDAFIDSAWQSAEPGAMYYDTVIRNSTTYPYKKFGFEEISSNPCLPGYSLLLTENGLTTLDNIQPGMKVWSESGWTTVTAKWSTGVKPVFKYTTSAGSFFSTANHRVISGGKKLEVGLADSVDSISGNFQLDVKIDPQDVMDGLVIGDGSVHDASNNLVFLYIGSKDQDYFNSEVKHLITKHRPGIKATAYEITTTIKPHELPKTYNRSIPERFFLDRNKAVGFLRGLYSANGSVTGGRVTLKTASPLIREQVQILLSSLGISSYFTTNKPTNVKFSNGEYICKESYDVNITIDKAKFLQLIGFIQQYKTDKLIQLPQKCRPYKKSTYDIRSVEAIGEYEVFEIVVDNDSHTVWCGGCNISNCGEQYLPKYGCCRLICLNLYSYVIDKFTSHARFDWESFKRDVALMQRFADDMVDLDIEAMLRIIKKIESDPESQAIKQIGIDLWKKIIETSINDRRTGCGLTGLGDTIAALGLRYGSDESLDFAEEMQKQFKLSAFRSSVDMAKELGPFPVYSYNLDKTSQFIERIKDEDFELYNDMMQYGRRNMTLLTIAPTGSVSCLTQTTSGIEPVFMLSYTRRKKGNPGDKDFRSDFVDQNGDHWMHFDVWHKGLDDWKKISQKDNIDDSPYSKSSAHEIDYIKRVELQARLQKHIDNSISTTINLPSDITKEKVSDIYLLAWKLGCKGMTIYRDGCRTGVLISKDDEQKTQNVFKRPKELPCDVHHIVVKGKPYFVLIGKNDDGNPYELFAGKNGMMAKSIKSGKIIKMLRPKGYKAILEDGSEICPITMACDENEEALTRMVSMSLRHGVEIRFIVDQLGKVDGDMYSFAKALTRALKHYVKDGEASTDRCQQCGEKSLVYSEGCRRCTQCGYSACS